MQEIEQLIEYNASLSSYSTFQLGGPCKGIIPCTSPVLLEQAIEYLSAKQEDFIVIGLGSNLLFADKGIDVFVLRYVSDEVVVEQKDSVLTVPACLMLDRLVEYSVEAGLDGLVALSGIPGTVGGAIVGNAGAFGRQVSDYLASIEVISPEGKKKDMTSEDLNFSYRSSLLKETRDIVTNVTFGLSLGNKEELLKQREEILSLRREKHPDYHQFPCAGSFFRNIEPKDSHGKRESAGLLLEQVHAKELTYGGASVFPKHANIIINSSQAKAQDVYELSKTISKLVKNKFDIDLIREVRFVGEFENSPFLKKYDRIFW